MATNNTRPAEEQQYAVTTVDKIATKIAKDATTWIVSTISNGELKVPKGYNVGSEIALAMMKIAQTKDRNQRGAIEVCTKDSIFTALREMAMRGLSMAQNQCYPIVYGDQLQIQRSYFGALASLRRIFPDYDISASVVYQGDDYEYGYNEYNDCYYVKVLKPLIKNRDVNKIELVFGTIRNKATKEVIFSEVMTMDEVKRSWRHAKTTKVHEEHPDQMAKRTLLNRMCKLFVNTYPLDPEQAYLYNQSVSDEYEDDIPTTPTTPSSASEYAKRSSGGNEGLKQMLKKTDVETVEATVPQERKEEPMTPAEESVFFTPEENLHPTEDLLEEDIVF